MTRQPHCTKNNATDAGRAAPFQPRTPGVILPSVERRGRPVDTQRSRRYDRYIQIRRWGRRPQARDYVQVGCGLVLACHKLRRRNISCSCPQRITWGGGWGGVIVAYQVCNLVHQRCGVTFYSQICESESCAYVLLYVENMMQLCRTLGFCSRNHA